MKKLSNVLIICLVLMGIVLAPVFAQSQSETQTAKKVIAGVVFQED